MIGPHILQGNTHAATWAAKAPIVKSMYASDLAGARDGAVRVYRCYFPDQSLTMAPEDAALAIIAGLAGYAHPLLYVELFNECYQTLDGGLAEYAEWTRRATITLHNHGLKVAGFSFSTGNPGPEEWAFLAGAGFAGVDAISVREYWGNEGLTGWNALRYRQAHAWINAAHPPFLIGECGRDAVEGGLGGWKRDGVTPEAYTAEIVEYAKAVAQDVATGLALGACLFAVGTTPDWAHYAADELVAPLMKVPYANLYVVGPGIADAIREDGYIQAGDETYFLPGRLSFAESMTPDLAPGPIYWYAFQTNGVYRMYPRGLPGA